MSRKKELKHPKMITAIVESETYDKLMSILPRKKSVSEVIRNSMEVIVEEHEATEGYIPLEDQTTLDIFPKLNVDDVKKFINNTEDRAALNHIRVLGEQMVLMTRTKLRVVNKDLQI